MTPILIYYVVGLSLALAVGAACYFTVGYGAAPLLRVLFGDRAALLWGRLFRISLVTVALVGALSTKFYGCHGPTDYAEVASSHDRMLERTTNQLASSLDSTVQYLVLTATLGALAFAIHQSRQAKGR
jgi:hypothetical protein